MLSNLRSVFSIASICLSFHLCVSAAMATNSALQFSIGFPGAITTDLLGNVYLSSPNLVLKLDTRGTLTRVAGNMAAGYAGDGSAATQALLNFPRIYPEMVADPADFGELIAGLAVDTSGNLYIADAYNDRVRKVDTRGVITTVMGPSAGPAKWPQGLASDAAGNLYISYAYGVLLKRTPEGAVSNFASPLCGPGFGGTGLCAPEGIAVDASGNVYAPDGYCRVRKVGTDGSVVTIAGEDQVPDGHGFAFTCGFSGDGGPATQAALSNQPFGVAVDRIGNVYIADTYNHRIRKVDATGIITTVAGIGSAGYSGDGGPAANARLNFPHGVALDAAGNIYIADSANGRIRKISSDGIITTVAGGGSAAPPPAPDVAEFTIGAGITGSWYDPAQNGHGLFIEVLSGNRFFASWFAFNPAGTQQAWFTGVGSYTGNIASITTVQQPTGGRWIPNFDSNQVVRNAWGTLTFTFTDCDHGKVDFNSIAGYGTGSMNLTRLTQPAGLACP